MRAVIDRLADAGWIASSKVSDKELRVIFTPQGLERLAILDSLMKDAGWPQNQDEVRVFHSLCRRADDQRGSPTPQ